MMRQAYQRHLLSGCAFGVTMLAALSGCGQQSDQGAKTTSPARASVVQTKATGDALTWKRPVNIITPQKISLDTLQHAFDVYSWQLFVSLNWPANADGAPDTKAVIGQTDRPGVWQSWKETNSVFLPGGKTPPAWNQHVPPPKACMGLGDLPVIQQIGKRPLLLAAHLQPFRDGPLIDQEGRYTRYQISINRAMFNYILANHLYSKRGQEAFEDKVQFACASSASGTDPYAGTPGATMVKTSWKILDPKAGDDPSRFHTAEVLVYTPPAPGVKESCEKEHVGLVGMHIASKLPNQPQWTWSTFEQVDNAPEKGDVDPNHHYNYYKANCTNCSPVNTPPPQPWDPNKRSAPSQVVREIPITPEVKALNAAWHARLKAVNPHSVWLNYMLVGTQWPTQPGKSCAQPSDPIHPNGNPAPPFLANSTLETYIQGRVPRSSSSCIACHHDASDAAGRPSDMTYVLGTAQ